MVVMTITKESQIKGLLDRVHDWWFDAEAVALDVAGGIVTIALEPSKRELTSPSGRGLIVLIAQVREMSILDTEKIGFYNLNEIHYSNRDKTVRITGGIPITIVVRVEGLEIELKLATQEG
jgi:hypothetical protein